MTVEWNERQRKRFNLYSIDRYEEDVFKFEKFWNCGPLADIVKQNTRMT